jgi:signal transduction histidine kinase
LDRHVVELDRANEGLKELDHLKAQFMANVTHELKTPLVAVRGYVESILEGRFGPVADAQRPGLEIALRNTCRLQNLIGELLDFERLESKELPIRLQDFDLEPVVRASLQALAPEIEAKNLVVRNRITSPVLVHADPEQIRRVILNLLSNAVKFSEPHMPVGLQAAVSEEEERVLVTVWDRGPGIPTAAQKFLFTRFWQADGTASRKHGGTGLGLAIVKGILDAHQAPIRIVSTGEGTQVHFELPLAQPAPAPESLP